MAEDFNLEAPNQERDLNNNGIPDIHEPAMQPHTGSGYQHQESYEVGRENTSGSPVVRHQREAMGHLSAAYTSANAGAADEKRRDRVSAQNAVASELERKIGSDPDQAVSRPAYEQALHDIDVERKRNAANRKKSSLPAELAATRPHKEDKAHGAEILTEMFKGLKAGHKHATQVIREQRHEQNQFEAEALKLRRANDQDLVDHELALAAIERKNAEHRDGDRATSGSADGGRGDGGPGGGGDGGPGGGGPGGRGPGETTTAEATAAAPDQTPTPANDVGPAQTPGRVAAEAEASPTVGGETGTEREPGRDADVVVVTADAPKGAVVEQAASAPAQATPTVGREPAGAEATGSAGMGAVLATVNPALGIAATALQTQGAQKLAGTDHASERQTGGRGPQLPGVPGSPPPRTRAEATFAPGQPARSLASPRPPAERGGSRIVSVPIRPSKQGGLHAQASRLPRPAAPVVSRAGPAPSAMARALGAGLGSGLLAVMRPVVAQNEGPSMVEQLLAQRSAGAGAGR